MCFEDDWDLPQRRKEVLDQWKRDIEAQHKREQQEEVEKKLIDTTNPAGAAILAIALTSVSID